LARNNSVFLVLGNHNLRVGLCPALIQKKAALSDGYDNSKITKNKEKEK